MSKRMYSFVVGLLVSIASLLLPGRNPFGEYFVRILVPGLVFVNSLQWLLLPIRRTTKIAGLCGSLLIQSGLCLSYLHFHAIDQADFVTFFFLFAVAQALLVSLATSDTPTTALSVAINLVTAFVVILGLFIYVNQISLPRLSGTRLLFVPLAAMLSFAIGTADRWKAGAQVSCIAALVQIAIGLADLGDTNEVRWLTASSLVAVSAALGLTAYWAKDLNK